MILPSMIKVQTLRLRGFCAASALLALAACSGSPGFQNTAADPAANPAADPAGGTALTAPAPQYPQVPVPQEATRRSELVARAVAIARRSLDLRLFEDARNEAAYALELANNNGEAREILQRCNAILGTGPGVSLGNKLDEAIIQDRIRQERERALVE